MNRILTHWKQNEIWSNVELLDESGNILEPGWAKSQFSSYNRRDVKAPSLRIKEWDYYLITNEKWALALTISDLAYIGLNSITFIDFTKNEETTANRVTPFPMGRYKFPKTSGIGSISNEGKDFRINFENDGKNRNLIFEMKKFKGNQDIKGNIRIYKAPRESIVMHTPFKPRGHFYYNQKINCMKAVGEVTLGDTVYKFEKEESFATLDWGRGVWPYKSTWYWASASGVYKNASLGWNLGYGFGNNNEATENCIYYNGNIHKLAQVLFYIPDGKGDPGSEKGFMEPWAITSDDNRFEMTFNPVLDRASCSNFLIAKTDQHQVFGYYSGKLVLDSGHEIDVDKFFGFAEKVINRW